MATPAAETEAEAEAEAEAEQCARAGCTARALCACARCRRPQKWCLTHLLLSSPCGLHLSAHDSVCLPGTEAQRAERQRQCAGTHTLFVEALRDVRERVLRKQEEERRRTAVTSSSASVSGPGGASGGRHTQAPRDLLRAAPARTSRGSNAKVTRMRLRALRAEAVRTAKSKGGGVPATGGAANRRRGPAVAAVVARGVRPSVQLSVEERRERDRIQLLEMRARNARAAKVREEKLRQQESANPYRRLQTRSRRGGGWSVRPSLESVEAAEAEAAAAATADESYVCEKCGSTNTRWELIRSEFDNPKSEVWGNKDGEGSVVLVQCRNCGAETHVTE